MKKLHVFKRICLIFILLLYAFHGSPAYAQDTGRITLVQNGISLEDAFEAIRAQTRLTVFYTSNLLNDQEKVNVRFQQADLATVMNYLLKGKGLSWNINDRFIVLLKERSPAPAGGPAGIRIKGTVSDDKGVPLPGVTVKLKHAARGVVTDPNGNYAIDVPDRQAVLVFTHISFITKEKTVGDDVVINMTLQEKDNKLTDVVVIGYGTVRKRDVTASVSSVGKEAMSGRTLLSLADALKGKAAGVQITQNDGTPGSESTIRIRGASSISGGSTPLFVIDGVMQDDANNINPGDIESIEILKDASGTAIYGARGANGVVLITTKTGRSGKTAVELYMNIGFQEPGRTFPVLNSVEYMRARYLASGYTYSAPDPNDPNKPATTLPGYTYYRDSPLGHTGGGFWGVAQDNDYSDWQNYASPDSTNTDWQRALFQRSAIQEYRISVLGGSGNTKYSFMGGYLKQGGLVVYSGYERYSGRFNFQQKLSRAFTLTSNISANRNTTRGFITGSMNGGVISNSVVTSMLNQPPIKPLTFSDVEDNEGVAGYITQNPYALAQKVTNNKYGSEWVTRLALDWDINKHFTFRVTGNYTNSTLNTDAYYPKYTQAGARFGGRAVVSRGSLTRLMNENLLYYKGRIGRHHNLNVMGGAIFEQSKQNVVTGENQNFSVEHSGVYGLGNGTFPIVPTYNITKWTMASFLGRAEYSYRDRYLATLTMRADGSSRFSRNSKWGYFPSAALAWRVSEERFLKGARFISNLKLRASLGQSGNTAIPSYLTLSTIATYFSPMDGVTPNFGVVVERPENLALKWETTTQLNTGVDLGLLNDKINITADWYLKRTKDLLIQVVTPGYSGYRNTWTNLGTIQNTGLEVNISTSPVQRKQFSWLLDANIGFNRSKAIEVGPDLSLNPPVVAGIGTAALIRNGQPIGQWFGYQTNGIFQSQEEINASGLTVINGQAISSIRPGTRRFVDQNGDGIINAADRVILGQGQPRFTGGLTNSLTYKGLNLNVVVQYSYGNKIYNANRVALEHGRSENNMSKGIADAWRPSLYDMTTGALYEQGNPSNKYRMPGSPEELLMLSDWIEDGSFIRVSDITLSYTFSGERLRKTGISGVNVFVSGKNLFIWTNYSGYDPEVNTRQGGFGDLMPSLDYAAYPRSKVYSFGLKAQF